MKTAIEIGTMIGKAMARDVLTEGYDQQWTGLDPQDADQLLAAGFNPDSEGWEKAEAAAKDTYIRAVEAQEKKMNTLTYE